MRWSGVEWRSRCGRRRQTQTKRNTIKNETRHSYLSCLPPQDRPSLRNTPTTPEPGARLPPHRLHRALRRRARHADLLAPPHDEPAHLERAHAALRLRLCCRTHVDVDDLRCGCGLLLRCGGGFLRCCRLRGSVSLGVTAAQGVPVVRADEVLPTLIFCDQERPKKEYEKKLTSSSRSP